MIKKSAQLIFCIALLWAIPAQAGHFSAWLDAFKREAVSEGISADALATLNDIKPNPRVIELDGRQPEHTTTFTDYQTNILNSDRIRRGQEMLAQYNALIEQVAGSYGVPAKYLVSLWGIETNYGKITGNYSILQSLLTLAYEGRRAKFFREELKAALRIIDADHIEPEAMRGSWAGAMGQCQFMPSTFLRYAVDGDGDGKRDIWNSMPDVFASMANYLRAEGWQPYLDWGTSVRLDRPIAPQLVGLKQGQPLTVWQSLGLNMMIEAPQPPDQDMPMYYLVQPDGAYGPNFIVSENYKALMRWNRSTYFATAVGLLADSLPNLSTIGNP